MRTRPFFVFSFAAAGVLVVSIALAAAGGGGRAPLPRAKRAELTRVAAPPGSSGLKPVRFAHRASAEPPWRRGVLATGLSPFPESAFVIENQWQELVTGRHVSVYAGSIGFDRTQGIVVVVETSPGGAKARRPSAYRTAARVGALRITRARGLTLELRAARGKRYVFDVLRRRLASKAS